jgi:hypothetical protein
MDDTVAGRQSLPIEQRSTAELVKSASEQISVLVRDELKLAELEMTRKGKAAALGIGTLSGSALVALFGTACLITCAILALSLAVAPWLAALIVGGALVAVARAVPPVPTQAAADVKADLEEITERTRR